MTGEAVTLPLSHYSQRHGCCHHPIAQGRRNCARSHSCHTFHESFMQPLTSGGLLGSLVGVGGAAAAASAVPSMPLAAAVACAGAVPGYGKTDQQTISIYWRAMRVTKN